jgi:adenylate cyclase class 2
MAARTGLVASASVWLSVPRSARLPRGRCGTDDGFGAGEMREIEVKYRVYDLAALERELAVRGAALSRPVHQDDQAYAPRGWTYGQPKTGVVFARLRSEGDRCLFTVKMPLDNEMACVEHETAVADRAQMHQAVLAMGFVPTVRIVKTRRSAKLGEIALCVDDVEHAGLFFEVEKVLAAAERPVAIQDQLDYFARSLGLVLDRVTDTYDSLVRGALAG